mmetsp:Transcript_5617/g.16068  ORF Transcript_5617/g.16068 Transcript_5617/m.16068 type:complete len:365 (-) Transcript_5617:292-1386(-)
MARNAQTLEAVVIGCGTPKFSMGWTHLFQLLQEPALRDLITVAGVVEPFFLSQAGCLAQGAELFTEFAGEHSEIPFVASCGELPPVAQGTLRVAVISVRTADSRRTFEDAVNEAGCRAVYLEKPGAGSTADMEEMMKLAEAKKVTVVVGYARNVGNHVRRAMEHAAEQRAAGERTSVTLLHSNPFKDEEMPACFQRCQPGMMYDMACHDLATAVAYYGLTAEGYEDLAVDTTKSVMVKYGGIEDFLRLSFSLRPKAGAASISFLIDRQAGAFNGIEVNGERFLSGVPPLLFENPLSDLAPHIAVTYDCYVEGKRLLFEALAAAPEGGVAVLPEGVPTMETARQVMLLADKLTGELNHLVPKRVE